MATVFQTEGFELGTNGANVATTNTIWSLISGTGITYSNSSPLEGSLSCRISTTATSFLRNSGFSYGAGVFRWLVKLTGYPSVTALHSHLFQGNTTTGTRLGELQITTLGEVRIRDFQTAVATSTQTLALNTVYAIEWKADLPNNSQTVRVYNTTATTGVTPYIEITGTLTLANTAANGAATLIEQIQIGQMTTSTGMTHFIDGYQRADDWIATAGTSSTYFFTGLNGTPENNVLIGHDDDYNFISTTPPKYSDDGVDVSPNQSVIMDGDASTERAISVYMNSNYPTTYERFYFKCSTAPATGQEILLWRAESNDRLSWVASMKMTPSTAGLYEIQIWEGATNTEVGSFTGIPLNSWMRIEVDLIENIDGTETDGTFRIYLGNNRHKTTASQTAVFNFTGVANKRRRTIQRGARNTGSANPAFLFDVWICQNNGSPGPVGDPYEPSLPEQYRFSEWNGVDETVLVPTYFDGTNELTESNSYVIGDTTIVGDTTTTSGRFPGDKGEGKILFGINQLTGASMTHMFAEQARIRAVSSTNFPASNKPTLGYYRAFPISGGDLWTSKTYSNWWGTATQSNWTFHRQLAANHDFISMNLETEGDTRSNALLNGNYDTWINTVLAPGLKEMFERYGTYYFISVSNEPDAWGKSNIGHSTFQMERLRKCARYLHFALVSAGVENATVTTPTTTTETARYHASRWSRTDQGSTSDDNIRWDALQYYHPDWKGTKTSWANAFSPNPVDFYGATDSDEYGTGPILKVWAHNDYCGSYHGDGGFEPLVGMSDAVYNTHKPSDVNHGWNIQRFLTALYGRKFPMIIGEWGYGARADADTETNPSGVKVDYTCNFWNTTMVQSLLDMGYIAVSYWHGVNEGNYNNCAYNDWGCLGWRQANAGQGNANGFDWLDDPKCVPYGTDVRRKMIAAMLNNTAFVKPTTTGTDVTSKPMSPLHA
jgi:hypothetical protein